MLLKNFVTNLHEFNFDLIKRILTQEFQYKQPLPNSNICVHSVSARLLRLIKNYFKCKLSTDHYTHRLGNMICTFAVLLDMHLK